MSNVLVSYDTFRIKPSIRRRTRIGWPRSASCSGMTPPAVEGSRVLEIGAHRVACLPMAEA